MLTSSAGASQGTMNSVVIGNLAVNLVMSASLQYLWGMINVMQLIVHMSQFNVQFPSNALFFYNLITSISNFDIVPQSVKDKLLSFGKALDGDADSRSILDNLGSMLIYLFALFVLVGVALLLRSLAKKHAW